MKIEQEQLVAELVQKIIDLSGLLINIAKAFNEAAGHTLGVASYALETG
jgi:hypothetical protein